MDTTTIIGLSGLGILVTGAALPARPVRRAAQSLKNWCFMIGGLCMLAFSIIGSLDGAPVLFVILQCVAVLSTLLMMLDVPNRYSTPFTVTAAVVILLCSVYLGQGADAILFILGLSGIVIGYEWKLGTVQRELALVIGSLMIVVFSYVNSSWIFFWLNLIFALLSGWQAWRIISKR